MITIGLPALAYCERTTAGLFGEPLNTLSNLAFFAAAIGAFGGDPTRPKRGFAVLVALIGSGSVLFHAAPSPATQLADVGPIGVFIAAYLVVAMRDILRQPAAAVGAAALLVLCASLVLSASRPTWLPNNTAGYLPALGALGAIAVAAAYQRRAAAARLLVSTGLLSVALAARAADLPLCGALPHGTHYIWHLLVATSLYLLVSALRAEAPERSLRRVGATAS